MRFKRIAGLVLAGGLLAGCEGPLDVDPTASVDARDALTNARALSAAVNGMYDRFQVDALYARQLVVYPEMYADNLTFSGTFQTDREVFQRNITAYGGVPLGPWQHSYAGINQANEVLAAIPSVSDVTQANAQRFRGEALFVRALHHFNLVRYFGGVIIMTEPVRTVEQADAAARPRNSPAEVWAQIEADLTEAITLLPQTRSPARATRDGARALLARAYLEQGKHAQARDAATAVINSPAGYQMVPTYALLWTQQNTVESIFEIQFSITDSNALAFWSFPARGGLGGRWGFNPSVNFRGAVEAGDERYAFMVGREPVSGRFYNRKYFRVDAGDDNVIILRLSEMYLIRAEANAMLGAAAATVRADIDLIRERAGLDPLPTTVTSQADLISAVLQERRVEFFAEGHRFFDLRRTGRAEQVLGIAPFRLLWPLPEPEMDVNPNIQQNPGY
jgi:starch-binding outer membrane protein, SusD/RagB family